MSFLLQVQILKPLFVVMPFPRILLHHIDISKIELVRPIKKKQTCSYILNIARQLHIFSIKPKLVMGLFVDFCAFT